jgi:formiminotetrahydrofolate cyclodeaminase
LTELDQSVRAFLDQVAAPTPSCTGGTVCAVTVAAAAGLVEMSAGVSREGEVVSRAGLLRCRATELVEADARAYAAVLAARRGPERDEALVRAARPPLRIALLAEEVAELATDLATRTRPALRGDALSAATLAAGSARGAATLVRVNLAQAGAGLDDADEADRAASAAYASAAVSRPPGDPSAPHG